MNIVIEPFVHENQHWVTVTMDGQKMSRYGPWSDSDQAVAEAFQLASWARAMVSDVVVATPGTGRSRHG